MVRCSICCRPFVSWTPPSNVWLRPCYPSALLTLLGERQILGTLVHLQNNFRVRKACSLSSVSFFAQHILHTSEALKPFHPPALLSLLGRWQNFGKLVHVQNFVHVNSQGFLSVQYRQRFFVSLYVSLTHFSKAWLSLTLLPSSCIAF